ncbi:MAG: hypothetical protein ABS918_07920, partial [Saccharopolyspora rectivirgula]
PERPHRLVGEERAAEPDTPPGWKRVLATAHLPRSSGERNAAGVPLPASGQLRKAGMPVIA